MKDRLFEKRDFLWACIPALITLALYIYTAAPNVTLEDSGELITGAESFGVPHPPGYPLWTFVYWVFQLLMPFGNTAWKLNVCTGVCGALAVGMGCALTRASLRWLLHGDSIWSSISALSGSLLLAFSVSMWSQSVVVEHYAMHSLLVVLYLSALLAWIRRPASKFLLLLSFFLLSLAFGHHQLTISLAPLPFLAVLLIRRRIIWDLLLASLLSMLLVYLGFTVLSGEPVLLKVAIRFFYFVMMLFAVLLWVRRGRLRWWLIAFLPFAIIAGLLPFAYLPVASSTNPPMNWAYARDPKGFYYSINRSQYGGSLSDRSLATLGKLLGVTTGQTINDGAAPSKFTFQFTAQQFVTWYWLKLVQNFTLACVAFYFISFFFVLRLPLPSRVWMYLLHCGFLLAAFFEPLKDRYGTDNASWTLQMHYNAYTYLIFSILWGTGAAVFLAWFARRLPRLSWLGYAVLLLPLGPLFGNYAESSQRNHWFGWQFGHDMLKDLPKGAVVYGGTDPGRFVPTYMIFGESREPAKYKHDPNFDRRDLYIITQNGLGEPLYQDYIADHYGKDRPLPKNAFERWLGRAGTYPAETLVLPAHSEVRQTITRALQPSTGDGGANDDPAIVQASVAKWIWEHNKDKHDFFVEESFPMWWSYPYAIPHGLAYQISATKLDRIPDEAVKKDMAFWANYSRTLLANPEFQNDATARHAFSKLRSTTGNIYRYRGMMPETKTAYREALDLWPSNLDALSYLDSILWNEGDYDQAIKDLDAALADDPNNMDILRMRLLADKRKELEGNIRQLEDQLAQQPKSRETIQKLADLYSEVGDLKKALPLLHTAENTFSNDADFLRYAVAFYSRNGEFPLSLQPAIRLTEVESNSAQNQALLAQAWLLHQDKTNFYKAAARAVELGGIPMRSYFQNNPLFNSLQQEPEYQKLVTPQTLPVQ